MSRPMSNSLRYFPLDVGFFSDKQITRLLTHFGPVGPMLYLYILAAAYGGSGYYVKADNDFLDDAAADLHCAREKIDLILKYLVSRSLLTGISGITITADRGNRDDAAIPAVPITVQEDRSCGLVTYLTSHGIQAQYQESCKGLRRDIWVDGNLWLLDAEETKGFVKVRPYENKSGKNPNKSGKNPNKSGKNPLNETKRNETNNTVPFSAEKDTTSTPEEQFEIFWKAYPRKDNRKTAKQKFLLALKNKNRFEDIMAGLERDKASDQWQRDGGHYIPMPTTWINQERWNNQGVDLAALGQNKEDRMTDDMELVPNKDGVMAWRKKKK